MSSERVNPDLTAVEAALASLSPAPAGLDRDRLMFLAGTSSARRRGAHWLWPASTAATTLLAVCLGVMLMADQQHVPSEQIAGGRSEQPAEPVVIEQDLALSIEREPIRANYLVLRRQVLNEGVDAMPPFRSERASARATLRWDSGRNGSLQRLLDG